MKAIVILSMILYFVITILFFNRTKKAKSFKEEMIFEGIGVGFLFIGAVVEMYVILSFLGK